MSGPPAPAWPVHLPPGAQPSDVDLQQGGSLPGAWLAAWRANPRRTTLSTLDGQQVSAAELEERSAVAARRLLASGAQPGDRVLLSAPTSVAMVVAYVGALRAGLTVIPANSAYTTDELARLVDVAQPSLAVLDDPARLDDSGAVAVTTVDLASLPPPESAAELDAASPEDTALIIYTSGTTGHPKGVPLSHANLLASAHAVRLAWRWEPDDRLALSLPLFHVHGLGVGLHGTLVTGAEVTLVPRFEPQAIGRAALAGATLFFGVPTMYHRLAESPQLADLSRLRLAVSGSAPLPAALHRAVQDGCGQVVLERYGMTETVMLVSNPYAGERRPGTVGFPLPGVEVRLAPREGGTAEIQVRGPNVVGGYLDDPQASADAYTVDGWFRTGDLGVHDGDGYLVISGRARELIITGGYNVYPREVEDVLREHPGVADAAVVGAPSDRWGEIVVAFVVPFVVPDGPGGGAAADGAALAADLEQWCEAHLAGYKRPRLWRVVQAVPRNALGKILRHELVP